MDPILETGLPAPIDLGKVNEQLKSGKESTVFLDDKDHVVSSKQFGSFWNLTEQGLLLCNTFNRFQDKRVHKKKIQPVHNLSADGPGIRFVRFLPSVENPTQRFEDEEKTKKTLRYKLAWTEARSCKRRVQRYTARHFKEFDFHIYDTETPILFRMGPAVHEKDDDALVQKIIQFHKFVISADTEAFLNDIHSRKIRAYKKPYVYPDTIRDISLPPYRDMDGNELDLPTHENTKKPILNSKEEPVDSSEEEEDEDALNDEQCKEEYIPEIVRDSMQQYVVFAMLSSPTLLNCVNESKYLREYNSSSPLGNQEYDEAIVVIPMRTFHSVEKATEFKENFAKHNMKEARICCVSMYKRINLLMYFTEIGNSRIPKTFRKESVQNAVVAKQERDKIKRDLAKNSDIQFVHLGPEQTKEEAQTEINKLKKMDDTAKQLQKIQDAYESIAKEFGHEALHQVMYGTDPSDASTSPTITEESGGGGAKK